MRRNMAWIALRTIGGSDPEVGIVAEIACVVSCERGDVLDEWRMDVYASPQSGRDHDQWPTLGPAVPVDLAMRQALMPWVRGDRITLSGEYVWEITVRWLRRHLPRTYPLFTETPVDIGTVRRLLRAVDRRLLRSTDQQGEALATAHGYVEEWQYYRRLIAEQRDGLLIAASREDPQ